MTQWTTRLPHFRRIPKHLDKKDFLDVHNMGSMIENVGRFMDFNYANFKDDANFLVNVLPRDILRIQEHLRNEDGENAYPMPEVLYVQLDNVNTNKSKLMIAYASWLVQQDVFRKRLRLWRSKRRIMHGGAAIPDRIQEIIGRPPVEIVYNGKRKAQGAAQKRAEQYVQNARWEVNYKQMTVGSFAVAFAVERENDKYAFRV
eukprot:gene11595-biopygen11904